MYRCRDGPGFVVDIAFGGEEVAQIMVLGVRVDGPAIEEELILASAFVDFGGDEEGRIENNDSDQFDKSLKLS